MNPVDHGGWPLLGRPLLVKNSGRVIGSYACAQKECNHRGVVISVTMGEEAR
jgi:hypothetical protein